MCKSFFFRQLVIILVTVGGLNNQVVSQQDLYGSRTLELDDRIAEGLYHFALSTIDPYSDMTSAQEVDRHKIIGLLHTRYPDLTYELERTPKQTISGKEISQLFVQILKEESSAQVLDTEDSFWGIVEDATLTYDEQATFKFLYAYELFKQKRFIEADKIFDKIIKERKGEYEYAFYYSGLIAMLNKQYDDAQDKLKKIGKDEKLKNQTPYYLAAAHYGNKDYNTVVKYYEPRIRDHQLHNSEGIIKIVAYAQYKSGDYKGAIASLDMLRNKRQLLPEENYVLGIAYQKIGNDAASSEYLSDIASVQSNISSKAQYEHALNLANQGNTTEAIATFERLYTNGAFDKDEINWNLAVLNGRINKYDKLAFHAVKLMDSNKKNEATALLSQVIDNIDNETVYKNIVGQLNIALEDKSIIKSSLYNKALTSLQQNNKDKAKSYFDLMADIDPRVEERGNVAAWRGIMAYEDENYQKASRLLSNYESTRPAEQPLSKLDFDVAYFLGYSNFKLKNHSEALGYFSKSLDILKSKPSDQSIASKEDDIFLRIGDSYFLLDEYQSAQRAYTQIINRNGPRKDYALWQNAIIAELDGRPYDQILILDEIVSDYKQSKYFNRARFNTANALFTIKEYDKAANFYNDIISSAAPTHLQEESTAQLGLISVNAGAYDKAEAYFQSLIDNSSNQDVIQRSQLALREIYADYTNNTEAYLDLVAGNDMSNNTEVTKALYDLALDNYEKGAVVPAIDQWTKLINEYPQDLGIPQTHLMLAKSYEIQRDWAKAQSSYVAATSHKDEAKSKEAYKRALEITFDRQQEFTSFLSLINKREAQYPKLAMSEDEHYRWSKALIATDQTTQSIASVHQYILTDTYKADNKTLLVKDLSNKMVSQKDWTALIDFYKNDNVATLVKKMPKQIYQRGLANFNNSNLDEAYSNITDHYDALLEEPAWLAKGIILIADISILKDDKDSAIAALEALIGSDTNIPPSLKETAKEKLRSLELQN